MSLQCRPLGHSEAGETSAQKLRNVTAACETETNYYFGTVGGALLALTRNDAVLERHWLANPQKTVGRRNGQVDQIIYLQNYGMLVSVSAGVCVVHDLRRRRTAHVVNTSSAQSCFAVAVAGRQQLIVASKYKLRVLDLTTFAETVVDLPTGLRFAAGAHLGGSALLVAAGGLLRNDKTHLLVFDASEYSLRQAGSCPCSPSSLKAASIPSANTVLLTNSTNSCLVRFAPNESGLGMNSTPTSSAASIRSVRSTASIRSSASNASTASVRTTASVRGPKVQGDQMYGTVFALEMPARSCCAMYSTSQVPVFAAEWKGQVRILSPTTGAVIHAQHLNKHTQLLSGGPPGMDALVTDGAGVTALRFCFGTKDLIALGSAEITGLGSFCVPENEESAEELLKARIAQATALLRQGEYPESIRVFTEIEEQNKGIMCASEVIDLLNEVGVAHHMLAKPASQYLAFVRRKLRLNPLNDENTSESEGQSLKVRVDTALFRCYIALRSPLVAPLLRSKNYCDADVVRDALLPAEKWQDLILFLKGRGRHREALQLLEDQSPKPEAAVVKYLSDVDDPLLSIECSGKALQKNPQLAEVLFFHTSDHANEIYAFLNKINAKEAVMYARARVLGPFKDQTPVLHNAVALSLVSEDVAKACEFVASSSSVEPRVVLNMDPEAPPRFRAALYERLGDADAAIAALLAAGDVREAARSAERNSKVNKLLQELSGEQDLVTVLGVVSAGSVDLELALKRINGCSVSSVAGFLSRAAVAADSDRGVEQNFESVARAALAERTLALSAASRQHQTITNESVCVRCHRRLGRAAALLQDGRATHYACAASLEKKL